jgi:hypothetical protein
LSKFDHVRKIRGWKQGTDIGKYSFANRTIKNWNQLPIAALGTFHYKPKIFGYRVRKRNYKWGEIKAIKVRRKSSKSAVK